MEWEELARQAYEECRGVTNHTGNNRDNPMKIVAWERITPEARDGWIRATQKTVRTFCDLSGIPWPGPEDLGDESAPIPTLH